VRDGAEVARWAHNPKVVGSNPAPATKPQAFQIGRLFLFLYILQAENLLKKWNCLIRFRKNVYFSKKSIIDQFYQP
jgi:hypothetical protein